MKKSLARGKQLPGVAGAQYKGSDGVRKPRARAAPPSAKQPPKRAAKASAAAVQRPDPASDTDTDTVDETPVKEHAVFFVDSTGRKRKCASCGLYSCRGPAYHDDENDDDDEY